METRLPVESSSEYDLERLKDDVDRLAHSQINGSEAFKTQLGTELGTAQPHGEVNVRKAGFGHVAGAVLTDIELRSAEDDPKYAMLVLTLGSSALAVGTRRVQMRIGP